MHIGLKGDNEMKIDIPVQPRRDTDFPSYVNWYLSNILIPYPLYIITTVDGNGIPNAQPNSWGLPYGSGNLNMFLFSTWTRHHTPQNVLETKEFVVNIHYPRGVDEIEASGLTSIPSRIVKTPRIAECKAHLECEYLWSHAVEISDDVSDIIIAGKIVAASADEDVLYGSAEEKLDAMETPYITNRDWKAKDPQMCGIISQIRNFWEMSR
jgi:flavin reductase (DIM6/NTAB) family NADH-FMN oxidoreductase RutF